VVLPMLWILALVLFIVLASPWNSVAGAILLLAGIGEVAYWWRTVKGRRLQTGAEAMVGRRAKVVADCHPDGRVSFDGALWNARCDDGADKGDSVVVSGRDGLLLIVKRD
jgi:membrane protein implicated in regulation of membrane protease activity